MTLSKIRNSILHKYHLGNIELKLVSRYTYLGVHM